MKFDSGFMFIAFALGCLAGFLLGTINGYNSEIHETKSVVTQEEVKQEEVKPDTQLQIKAIQKRLNKLESEVHGTQDQDE